MRIHLTCSLSNNPHKSKRSHWIEGPSMFDHFDTHAYRPSAMQMSSSTTGYNPKDMIMIGGKQDPVWLGAYSKMAFSLR